MTRLDNSAASPSVYAPFLHRREVHSRLSGSDSQHMLFALFLRFPTPTDKPEVGTYPDINARIRSHYRSHTNLQATTPAKEPKEGNERGDTEL